MLLYRGSSNASKRFYLTEIHPVCSADRLSCLEVMNHLFEIFDPILGAGEDESFPDQPDLPRRNFIVQKETVGYLIEYIQSGKEVLNTALSSGNVIQGTSEKDTIIIIAHMEDILKGARKIRSEAKIGGHKIPRLTFGYDEYYLGLKRIFDELERQMNSSPFPIEVAVEQVHPALNDLYALYNSLSSASGANVTPLKPISFVSLRVHLSATIIWQTIQVFGELIASSAHKSQNHSIQESIQKLQILIETDSISHHEVRMHLHGELLLNAIGQIGVIFTDYWISNDEKEIKVHTYKTIMRELRAALLILQEEADNLTEDIDEVPQLTEDHVVPVGGLQINQLWESSQRAMATQTLGKQARWHLVLVMDTVNPFVTKGVGHETKFHFEPYSNIDDYYSAMRDCYYGIFLTKMRHFYYSKMVASQLDGQL